MLALLLLLAAAQPDAHTVRGQFTTCMNMSLEKAVAAKVDAAAFAAFARSSCAAETGAFRESLIAYDLKAGWTRRKAEPDADQQIGEYVEDWSGRYKEKSAAK